MPPALLAIADDVQAGILLVMEGEADRVVLGLLEPIGPRHPRSEQLMIRISEPGGLGEASGERGPQHGRVTITGLLGPVNSRIRNVRVARHAL